jgi:hypothetical protein
MRAFDPAALFLAIIGLSDWINARFFAPADRRRHGVTPSNGAIFTEFASRLCGSMSRPSFN